MPVSYYSKEFVSQENMKNLQKNYIEKAKEIGKTLPLVKNKSKEKSKEIKSGDDLENVLQNNTVLIEKISAENDFINFIKSKQFKQILKNNEISDDEFKNFVETNLKDFGYMKEKVEKLNTFIQEKQKIKFKKINNLSNEKI